MRARLAPALAALLMLGAPARGGQREPPRPALALSGAWFDFTQQDAQAVQLGVEYRAGRGHDPIRPFGGVMVTTDGTFYVCAGIGWELFLGRVVVTPSLAPGWYLQGGGKDLGFPAEFRTQLEFAYRLPGGSRLGLAVSHLSNASLGKTNPGELSLTINYELPLRSRHASP
jgi:hypothetical protein